jgi:serine O-acetyltransferase
MTQRLEVVNADTSLPVWAALRNEAQAAAMSESALASLLAAVILNHKSLGDALSYQLARKLGDQELRAMSLRDICEEAYQADPSIVEKAEYDLRAVFERDPACKGYVQPFLFFKGFLALQTHRVAHWLWHEGRETLAFYLQSRSSELFQVDINPATRIGRGVFIDHGTGIVIGETAVIGDDVSMLQGVTLGGTGAERGDRHPKVGRGVLLGAGAKGFLSARG